MPINVIVIVKQVIDPETQVSALKLDPENGTVSSYGNAPQVVNGFDEQAVEAALRLKDQHGASVRLSEFHGKKNVVLAFYVLAFTGG